MLSVLYIVLTAVYELNVLLYIVLTAAYACVRQGRVH